MLACLAAGADAEATGTPQWKGVTWGMLPLHTSGIVACTYHLFYNAPAVTYCVTLQAAMTCLGNTTLAYACLRLALASGWTWEMGKADVLGALGQLLDAAGIERPESLAGLKPTAAEGANGESGRVGAAQPAPA